MRTVSPASTALNVVVVRGTLSRPPEQRTLASGDVLVGYELTVPRPGGKESVPVVWESAAATVDLEPGTEVLVAGRVRRRFFRAGGSTQSRTEVVADVLVPARSARKAARLLAEARTALGEVAAPEG